MTLAPETPAWPDTWGEEAKPRMGFFTDTSVCIGCKACEVACKEWNMLPEDGLLWSGYSYDNTLELNADTWRHVKFVEQRKPIEGVQDTVLPERPDFRWLMSSDVCKHCTHAGCLDVCPTGALFRTEFGTVVVQDDVCNGCGYCVPACPFGVIDRREPNTIARFSEKANDGGAHKCTLCYDRAQDGLEPACSKACPTKSINWGPVDDLLELAKEREAKLKDAGVESARLYGHDPDDGVGGFGAFFLLLDEPEVYGLPPDPVVPTATLKECYAAAAAAAGLLAAAITAVFAWGRG